MTALHAAPLLADDLIGRTCLDTERFILGTVLEASEDGQTVTVRYVAAPFTGSVEDYLPLPRAGERVTVTTGVGVVLGDWATVRPNADDRTLSVHLSTEDGMREIRCGLRDFTVVSTQVPNPHVFEALAGMIHERRIHDEWLEALVTDAHAFADRNSLCGVFDEFMTGHGLPCREREYMVQVDVTSTVYVSVSARSESDAEARVDREAVRANLDPDRFEWSVESAELSG